MSTPSDFNQRCYELLQQIPAGKVTTYREIARALGIKPGELLAQRWQKTGI